MPFQNFPKFIRHTIKYFDKLTNKHYFLEEIFDMKCCFVQLSAELAKLSINLNTQNFNNLINEFNNVKLTAQNDIYTDILNFHNDPELSRDQIKKNIMFWLFSTNFQRKHLKSNVNQSITKYFQNKFPNFYQFINNYQTTINKYCKKISKLSIDCFQVESKIIKQISNQLNHPVVINLHDRNFHTQKLPKC